MPKMNYIGKAWKRGIPARNLSAEEVEKYGGVELLTKTGLYEVVRKPKKVKKSPGLDNEDFLPVIAVTEEEPEV